MELCSRQIKIEMILFYVSTSYITLLKISGLKTLAKLTEDNSASGCSHQLISLEGMRRTLGGEATVSALRCLSKLSLSLSFPLSITLQI